MNPTRALVRVNPGKNAPPGFTTKQIMSDSAPVNNPASGPHIIPLNIIGTDVKFILSAGSPARGTYTSKTSLSTTLKAIISPTFTIVSVFILLFLSLVIKALLILSPFEQCFHIYNHFIIATAEATK